MSTKTTGNAATPGNQASVPVHIAAVDRGTEIVVIDASFAKVISGIGEVKHPLAPGIYKARFKTGDRVEDQLFEVQDQPLTLQGGLPAFSSPMPLDGSSNNHEYHHGPAHMLATAALAASDGTELFVFARDSGQPYGQPLSALAPWTGFVLLDDTGNRLVDIESQGEQDTASGFVSIKLALKPGQYFLARPNFALARNLLLPVVLCRGWSTHIYIDCIDHARAVAADAEIPSRVLDFAGSAVLMMQPGEPASWDPMTLRLTEIARQGLMRGRKAVSAEDLDLMINGNARFPMLGLYAAHMLLARQEIDWEKVCSIATQLDAWLGSAHPDVQLLLTLCDRQAGTKRKARANPLWPPLLAASWDLAGAENAEPAGKLRNRTQLLRQYRLGGSLWSCLLLPADAILPGAESAPRRRRKTSGGVSAMMSSLNLDDVALEAIGSAATAAARRAFDRHLASFQRPDAAAAGSVAVADASLNLERLMQGLAQPNPAHTPFQQALRRRILDLIADDDVKLSARELLKHIHDLARQFRLDKEHARDAFTRLRTDALAALDADQR